MRAGGIRHWSMAVGLGCVSGLGSKVGKVGIFAGLCWMDGVEWSGVVALPTSEDWLRVR